MAANSGSIPVLAAKGLIYACSILYARADGMHGACERYPRLEMCSAVHRVHVGVGPVHARTQQQRLIRPSKHQLSLVGSVRKTFDNRAVEQHQTPQRCEATARPPLLRQWRP